MNARKFFFAGTFIIIALFTVPYETKAFSADIKSNGTDNFDTIAQTPVDYTVTLNNMEPSDPPFTVNDYIVLSAVTVSDKHYTNQTVCQAMLDGTASEKGITPNVPPLTDLASDIGNVAQISAQYNTTGMYRLYTIILPIRNSRIDLRNMSNWPGDVTDNYCATSIDPTASSIRPVNVTENSNPDFGESINLTDQSVQSAGGSAQVLNDEAQTHAIKEGDTIGAKVNFNSLNTADTTGYNYKILAGKIEGSYKGPKQTCLDLQSGVNQTDYGVTTLKALDVTRSSDTDGHVNIGSRVTRTSANTEYRLVGFLFRVKKSDLLDPAFVENQPGWCSYIDGGWWKMDAKGFSASNEKGDGKSDDGSAVKPKDVHFITGSGGFDAPDVAAAGDVAGLSAAGSTANITEAFCKALAIRLPGTGGKIDLNKAGVLGICNTRPLLVNLINILLILAGIFFVGAIIYSGIMLVQASSDDVAAKAKNNMVWAAIGAVIVILANWIVPFIISVITATLKGPTP